MVTTQDIRTILARHGALAGTIDRLSDDDCLFDHGLDSFAAVQAMMDLEEHFGIEFPEHLLNRETFSTVGGIRGFVSSLLQSEAA